MLDTHPSSLESECSNIWTLNVVYRLQIQLKLFKHIYDVWMYILEFNKNNLFIGTDAQYV